MRIVITKASIFYNGRFYNGNFFIKGGYLENLQLLHGDCLEIMQNIPDKSVDLILCDLPYGTTDAEWDKAIPLDQLWEQYNRIRKDSAPVALFGVEPFTSKLITSNLKQYRYNWYWLKSYSVGFSYSKFQPLRRVETISVFYQKGGQYFPQGLVKIANPKTKQGHKNSELLRDTLNNPYTPKYKNYPKNVLEFANEATSNRNRLHPTQKPVKLLEYLIKTYTKENDIVLDNCMGSGSTGVAAVNTGRKFIGIEKENKYFGIAKQRIESAAFSVH